MAAWVPITELQQTGLAYVVARESTSLVRFPFPLTAKFLEGSWQADFGDRWANFDPQPTHWYSLDAKEPKS